MPLLQIKELCRYFEGLVALESVSFSVHESEILGLIGPNGAGKTTLFNVITGFVPATSGSVLFNNTDLTGYRADQVAQMGIGRTFQASILFMQATVFENMCIAFHKQYKQPGWKCFFHTRAALEEELSIEEKAGEIIEFIGLSASNEEYAANLPHGSQRLLGVGLALATKPKLLLLDEPVAGMNPVETDVMVDLIRKVRDKGTTVVIVEHDMKAIMSLCDRIVALHYGRIIAEGSPIEIRKNEALIEAYLGRDISY